MQNCQTCELVMRRDANAAPLWDCIYRTRYWDVVHHNRVLALLMVDNSQLCWLLNSSASFLKVKRAEKVTLIKYHAVFSLFLANLGTA